MDKIVIVLLIGMVLLAVYRRVRALRMRVQQNFQDGKEQGTEK